jgi:Uma2 family endonuclease
MNTTSLLTFAEFEQLPETPGKRELVDGEVIEVPPPKFTHTRIARRFFDLLRNSSHADRVWPEAGYRIGGGWLQPDVSISWEHQRVENDYLIGSPMLAVEVLSPSNTAADVDRKLTLYFTEDAGEVWVVALQHRTMTVYRRDVPGGAVLRIPVETSYSSEGLGITIELSQIFD